MRHIVFTLAVVFAFGLACFAQATTPGNPSSGVQGTNPTTGTSAMGSPATTGSQSGSTIGSQSPGTMESSKSETSAKGEKKLKGCIESQGGQYMLQEKSGKQVKLTGSADFASHVGHEVTVHGTYQPSAENSASNSGGEKMPSSSGSPTANPTSPSSSEQEFMVNKIDHESDTCKLKGASGKSGSSGMSGTSSSGTQAPDHQ